MKSITLLLALLKYRFKALYEYLYEFFDHIEYCTKYHFQSNHTKDMSRCSIMLLNHQLEKAQTYDNPKMGYGKDKVITLLKHINNYTKQYGYDTVIYTSIGVLKAHMDNEYSYKDSHVLRLFQDIIENIPDKSQEEKELGGVIVRNLSQIDKLDGLYAFMDSRRSCRQFSIEAIDFNHVQYAVNYAMTAPSACNRQCVRAHYYDDPKKIKDIIYAQKSDINWCLNAKGLFIITANRSCFRDYFERNQRLFDAGLFSMNLVLGLHNQGIGSCFKMAQKEKSIDAITKKIADIPNVEDICVLLLIGKYPDKELILAKSSRLEINEILTKH